MRSHKLVFDGMQKFCQRFVAVRWQV
jgi:hypothetical protein